MIKRSALPKGIITKLLGDTKLVRTLAGCLKTQEVVTMQDIRLPEFNKNRRINQQKVLVFDNDNVKYDIILGTNFLSKTGIKLNYSEENMEWFDWSIPLGPPGGLDSKEFEAMEDMFHIQVKDEIFGEDWLECFAKQICFKCYRKMIRCLMELLEFIHTKKVHIDIDSNAQPVHSRPYLEPQIQLKTFKKELNHLVRIGILAAQQESEWASPSFIIPKKDSRVCWISNLHQLNKVIRCKQYPLPIITDILHKRSGYKYKFFTKLDFSMQYYMFELDKESQGLCTIITPFGKHKYFRLPMGLKCSPDIAQAAMENVLSDIEDANVYINDVGAFFNDWYHHVNLLATILKQLCDLGLLAVLKRSSKVQQACLVEATSISLVKQV
jgi:hypothetical protein